MTTQTRVVVAALAAVAALFVASVVNGTTSSSTADLREPGGIAGWFGARFGDVPDADPADLSAPCLAGDTLTVRAGTCVLTVAAAGGRRSVRLRTDSDVAVQAPAPGQDTLVRSDAKAGDTLDVTVDKAGAGIDLICAGERTCVLTVVRED